MGSFHIATVDGIATPIFNGRDSAAIVPLGNIFSLKAVKYWFSFWDRILRSDILQHSFVMSI